MLLRTRFQICGENEMDGREEPWWGVAMGAAEKCCYAAMLLTCLLPATFIPLLLRRANSSCLCGYTASRQASAKCSFPSAKNRKAPRESILMLEALVPAYRGDSPSCHHCLDTWQVPKNRQAFVRHVCVESILTSYLLAKSSPFPSMDMHTSQLSCTGNWRVISHFYGIC